MRLLTWLWYREFRRVYFTPWQSLKIARRMTMVSPAELRQQIGEENYRYAIRSAHP